MLLSENRCYTILVYFVLRTLENGQMDRETDKCILKQNCQEAYKGGVENSGMEGEKSQLKMKQKMLLLFTIKNVEFFEAANRVLMTMTKICEEREPKGTWSL